MWQPAATDHDDHFGNHDSAGHAAAAAIHNNHHEFADHEHAGTVTV